jgi:polar amino acid transport system substrate-binding protein
MLELTFRHRPAAPTVQACVKTPNCSAAADRFPLEHRFNPRAPAPWKAQDGGRSFVFRENTMQMPLRLLMTVTLGALLSGCAGLPTSTAPAPEVRQALAPTGKLRVALQRGNALNVTEDPVSGEMKGLGFELGKELARRIGVPFQPVLYPSIGSILDSGRSGGWDVAHFGFSPERAKEFDFAPVHLEVEFGYLVRIGSSVSTMADVDRAGVRVAVQEKSGPDAFFTRNLKNAALVRASSNPGALEALRSGSADAMGSIKPILFDMSNQLPGSQVLDGRPGTDPHAVAMPKGRDRAMPYLHQFMEDAKSRGLIKAALERSGLRGALVAPGK